MEDERRESPREECDCRLSVLMDDRELEADLRNISRGGAFLHVTEKDNDKVTFADTEKVVTFRVARGESSVNYKGSIDRYIEDNNNKYLAVVFYQRNLHEFI